MDHPPSSHSEAETLPDARNDFDGDGRSDILWAHLSAPFNQVGLWLGQLDGTFANQPAAYASVADGWYLAGSGDFNRDGRDDVLWRHESGLLGQWLAQQNGVFANNKDAYYAVGIDWYVAGTGDFNGDGWDDILWRNNSGLLGEWLGQDDGGFVNNPSAYAAVDNEWRVAGIGDFNGDGGDDILWRHESGLLGQWLSQENGVFTNNAAAYAEVTNEWLVAGIGDFNGDDADDILWRHQWGVVGQWVSVEGGVFTNNPAGNTVFTTAGGTADQSAWHIVSIGDYDGGGRDDVLWRHDSGAITKWTAQENGAFSIGDAETQHINPMWQLAPELDTQTGFSPKLLIGDGFLVGTLGRTEIHGSSGDDTIFGLAGDDELMGQQGTDTLYGGAGNDRLFGNNYDEADVLHGGSGSDVFHFTAHVTGWGPHTPGIDAKLADFQSAIDSIHLQLSGVSWTDSTVHWLGSDPFTGQNRLEARFSGGVLEIDSNGDLLAELTLMLAGTLSASDIYVV